MNLLCKIFGHKDRDIYDIFGKIKYRKCKKCKYVLIEVDIKHLLLSLLKKAYIEGIEYRSKNNE